MTLSNMKSILIHLTKYFRNLKDAKGCAYNSFSHFSKTLGQLLNQITQIITLKAFSIYIYIYVYVDDERNKRLS